MGPYEISGSAEDGKFLDKMNDCYFLEDSAP
jgi:hypothetical protein